jgi:hypothetical protein
VRLPLTEPVPGCLRVKGVVHELACQLGLDCDGERLGGPPLVRVTGSWVLDAGWVTGQRVPGLGRPIPVRCSVVLVPGR